MCSVLYVISDVCCVLHITFDVIYGIRISCYVLCVVCSDVCCMLHSACVVTRYAVRVMHPVFRALRVVWCVVYGVRVTHTLCGIYCGICCVLWDV